MLAVKWNGKVNSSECYTNKKDKNYKDWDRT